VPKTRVNEIAPELPVSMPSPAKAAEPTAVAQPATAKPAHGHVVLPVSCTIHEAQSLRKHLLEQLELPGPCEIDGGSVQQVDTAGVQLVLAFTLDCLERGRHYVWKSRSPALESAIQMLNVGALMESPGFAV